MKHISFIIFGIILFSANIFAADFGSPLSEFTGVQHELTDQLRRDVDLVLDQAQDFDEVYDATITDKTYVGSRVQRETITPSQSLIWTPHRDWDDSSLYPLMSNYLQNKRIDDIISRYTWYVSDRYIDNYGDCSRHNFMRAFDEFGTTILQPGQSFNINKLLAGLDDYCTGIDDGEYLFYQGVCGFSTQVWRNALINPYLATTKRANHSSRRQAYYGQDIVGDDAAIYEMDKQLEIQNQSDLPIYMRTIELAGKKYLLSVVPKQSDKVVEIRRQNIGRLQGQVIRTIKDKLSGDTIDVDNYVSNYYGVVVGSN